ncbi:MAG: hypothetical protein HOW97_15185 [Catenulispora sp.]|nr:hypothetical protein [Catenulispora sp.]
MSVEGSWQLVVRSPMGKQHITVLLHDEAGALTGTLTNDANHKSAEIFDGSVAGDAVQWKVTLQDMPMTLAFQATVDGDTLDGKVKAGRFGRFGVSGRRVA